MKTSAVDVTTVVGARPQFIKCALVSRALRAAGVRESLLHTGQHYDEMMSDVFFQELNIPAPDRNLGVGSGSHASQTAAALTLLETEFLRSSPRLVLVYGDTNSTLAGALAAVKLGIDVAHVESGLRSYNRQMPEEINRIATDHWSSLLFCHNSATSNRLCAEQVRGTVVVVGDVMREILTSFAPVAISRSAYPSVLGLETGGYAVLTVHRPVNADREALRGILEGCSLTALPVVFPTHPRTSSLARSLVSEHPALAKSVRLSPPLGYLDMLALTSRARFIITDSGGLQKEAFFLRVPCVTIRGETEWVETLEGGWNVLAGDRPEPERIRRAVSQVCGRTKLESAEVAETLETLFGPPDPVRRIVDAVIRFLDAAPRSQSRMRDSATG